MAVHVKSDDRSEEELLCQAQAGSSDSFGVLCERYRRPLLRYLERRRLQAQDAEDVVQETFVRAYANLASYEPGRPFAAWLFTIATRSAVSQGRTTRRETPSDDLDPADPADADPGRLVAEAHDGRGLWAQAARLLPDRQHLALQLRYGQGLSVRETAAAMGLTTIHVKVLLFRARRKLLNSAEFVEGFADLLPRGRASKRGVP